MRKSYWFRKKKIGRPSKKKYLSPIIATLGLETSCCNLFEHSKILIRNQNSVRLWETTYKLIKHKELVISLTGNNEAKAIVFTDHFTFII